MATNATIIMAEHEGDATLSPEETMDFEGDATLPPEETMDFDDNTLKGDDTIANVSRLL